MTDFGPIAWVAVFYEIGIIWVLGVLSGLAIKRYMAKKNKLVRLLTTMFLFYFGAVVFSLVSKVINAVWGGVPYLALDPAGLWIVSRLHAGRFSFVCVIISTLFAYEFKVNVFHDGKHKKIMRILLYVASVVSIAYQIFVYEFDVSKPGANQLLEVLGFADMLLLTAAVYIPFLKEAYRTWSRLSEPKYKQAFRSLIIMAIGFISIFVCFLLDRVMLIVADWPYSIFYFMAWVCAIIAIYSGYRGYLYPKTKV